MDHFDYVGAVFGERSIVCCIELKPFCAGHYLLLARSRSPFIYNLGRDIDITDLAVAVNICSLSFAEGCELINDTKASFDRGYEFQQGLLKAYENAGEVFDFNKSIEQFKAYMKLNNMEPPFIPHNNVMPGGKSLKTRGGHWLQDLVNIACKELNYTRDEALNAPLSQLNYDVAWVGQNNDALEILTNDTVDESNIAKEEI